MQDVKGIISKSSEKEDTEASDKSSSIEILMLDIGRERYEVITCEREEE